MAAVIDTSSLLSLVRYYLPFDKSGVLLRFFEEGVAAGEIVLLDKIIEECKYVAQGIVLRQLPSCTDKSCHQDTASLLPYARFYNQVDHQFIIPSLRRKLNDAEYDSQKNAYLESADVKLLLYCLKNKGAVIVTEETAGPNDKKLFKKIPAICNMLQLPVDTLPQYLQKTAGIDLHFSRTND